MAIEQDLVAGDEGVQCRDEFFPATDYERDTLRHRFSAHLQCVRHLRQARPADRIARGDPRLEELEQSSRLREQTRIVSSRQPDQQLSILRLAYVRDVARIFARRMRLC